MLILNILSQWNMVCDRKMLVSVVLLVFSFGVLISSVVGGHILDRCYKQVIISIINKNALEKN